MKIIFTILLIISSPILFAQEGNNSESTKQTSFLKHINDGGKSRGVTVEQTTDEGYILVGYTTDGDYGAEDVLLIKTDTGGNILWRKTFGGEKEDYGWAVRQTSDGGFIISGYTNSFGNGGMDVYLIRTNQNGETVWTKTFGGNKDEYGWDVRITEDQGYIIASQTNSLGNGEADAYLIKVDHLGNEEWSKTYGGDKTDRVFSVQQDDDGNYVAAGISYSYDSVGPNDRDGYLLKTDNMGNELWSKTYGKSEYDVIHDVSLTNDNEYILTGYGESYSTSSSTDVYLIKTDSDGQTQWLKTYGEAANERGIKGEQTSEGGYITIGFTDKDLDLYLMKSDSSGEHLWTRTYGQKDKVDFGYTVKQTKDGGYILIGHSQERDGSVSNMLFIKTDKNGNVAGIK